MELTVNSNFGAEKAVGAPCAIRQDILPVRYLQTVRRMKNMAPNPLLGRLRTPACALPLAHSYSRTPTRALPLAHSRLRNLACALPLAALPLAHSRLHSPT